MSGTNKNTSQDPKRHGHTGNTKNWQVQYRDNAAERAEKKEFGCTNVDLWEISPNLRETQAYRMIDRLEAMKFEWKLVNLNLIKEVV